MPNTKSRGNGQGSVYKRDGKWVASVVIGWKPSSDGSKMLPIRRMKCGFQLKRDAVNYIPFLFSAKPRRDRYTLRQLYDEWVPFYSPRVGKSAMDGYYYAFKHFSALDHIYVDIITAMDLQDCMDKCPAGKRTHENMRTIAGLLWAYAVDRQIVDRDVTDHLYIGKHETAQREPLTEKEVEVIRQAIGKERYAEYVFAMCYLGFRPGEFLSLRKDHYRVIDGIEVLINGSKTEAGRDRVVVIPPQILDLIRSRLFVPGTDLLFPRYCFTRKKPQRLTQFCPFTHEYFNKHVFKPMMKNLNIAEGKVPYSARHTYSDKLKNAAGTDKAKAALMGHTDYEFTQAKYQSTNLDDLLDVATSME